jgi:glycosyltransferase involved in cell wall biosynthesis
MITPGKELASPSLRSLGLTARDGLRRLGCLLPGDGRGLMIVGGKGSGGPNTFARGLAAAAHARGVPVTDWRLGSAKAALIITNSWGDWFYRVCRKKGVRTVLRVNGFFSPDWYDNRQDDPDTTIFQMTTELMAENYRLQRDLTLSDHVVYQSHYCKEMADRFLYQRHRDYSIILNGADLERFRPPERKPPGPGEPLVIGFAGLLRARYPMRILLSCLAEIIKQRPCRLLLIGTQSDDSQQELSDTLARLPELAGLVEPLGTVSHSEMARQLGRVDVYVHAKPRDPCPNVVAEALACGRPVVCASTGGAAELAGEGGLFVPWSLDGRDWEALGKEMALRVLRSAKIQRNGGARRGPEPNSLCPHGM